MWVKGFGSVGQLRGVNYEEVGETKPILKAPFWTFDAGS